MTEFSDKAWTCINRWDRRGYVTQVETFKAIMAENEKLRAALEEEQASTEALEAKLKSESNCACSHDNVDDICMCHSPKLAAANLMIARLEADVKQLHGICDRAEKALLRQIRWDNDCVDAAGAIVCSNPENCACKAEAGAMVALEGEGK